MSFFVYFILSFFPLQVHLTQHPTSFTWPKVRNVVSGTNSGFQSCNGVTSTFKVEYSFDDPLSVFFVNRTEQFLRSLTVDNNGISTLQITYLSNLRYYGFDLYDGKIDDTKPYEYYELEFTGKGITLRIFHILGLLRGLQTLEQMINLAVKNPTEYSLCDKNSKIVDFPRYRYRGILLDTARNFYSTDKLKEIIRIMSLARFTVLHWHLTDSQSLPYQSKRFSNLENGAFSPSKYYTKEDIENIRLFGLLYGIQIIIEVDLPGHSYSFTFGYPNLLPSPQTDCQSVSTGCSSRTHPCSMTLPNSDLLFDIVGNIINETSSFHQLTEFWGSGMDEFAVYCWENDPVYTSRGFSSYCEGMYDNLLFEFAERYISLASSSSPQSYPKIKVLAYDDIYLTFPNEGGGSICKTTKSLDPKNLIILVWGGSSYFLRTKELRPHEVIQEATGNGFEVIVGNYERWYFGSCSSRIVTGDQNFYKGLVPNEGLSVICGDPWKRYWMYDPTDGVSEDRIGKILGGEGLLWETEENVAMGALGFESGYEASGHQGFFIGERLWGAKMSGSERSESLEDAKKRIKMFVRDFRDVRVNALKKSEGYGMGVVKSVVNIQKYWKRPQNWVTEPPTTNNDVTEESFSVKSLNVFFCVWIILWLFFL